MEKLVEILREQTQTLKEQYLKFTKEWSSIEFDSYKKQDFVLTRTNKNSQTVYFSSRFGKTKSEDAKIVKVINVLNSGLDKFLDNNIKDAQYHYETSLLKLANRINEKGLDIDNLKVETSYLGVNFETTLTDGIKKVRAFTVIAQGEIQRPHYRYLIK